jgi:diguanylate cyclase (GGDEF)-like protein/PAS domain S-box-containing protein
LVVPDNSTLFDLLPIGAYRFSHDGVFLRANQAFARLNGYPSEAAMNAALRGTVCNPYIDPKRRDVFAALMHEQGQVTNFESEMRRMATGERMWVREHAHVVLDAQGKLLYFEGTLEDITQERMAKAALRQSEALLRNVVQTIPDRIWLKDLHGVYLTCNEAYATAWNTTPQGIVGTRDEDWATPEAVAYFLQTDQLALQAGKSIYYEDDLILPSNPEGQLHEIIKTPMRDADGKLMGVLGLARNIQERKRAENLLRDTTEQMELALMGADLGRWDHDLLIERGYYLDERSCKILGRDPEESRIGRAWGHLIHPDDLPAAMHAMRAHLTGNTPSYQAEYRARHTQGRWLWLSSRGKVVQFAQDGTPKRMVGTLMDISVRKQTENQLRATQAELQATLSALPDLLFEFNATGHYRAVHSQDIAQLDHPIDFLLGKAVDEVLPKEAADAMLTALREAHVLGRSHGVQYSLELPHGKVWFELSIARKPTLPQEEERFIAIARDITERKNAEEAIRHLAFHDTLTGLPNRRMLMDRLQRAITASARKGDHGALMFLDLDRFKQLNDSHGHDVGDLMLQEVSRRLQLSVRAIDTVARLGGDEFVVLIQDLSEDPGEARLHATAVGHKILASLNDEFVLNDRYHNTSPSIGVALFAGDAYTAADLLKQADMAMYQAKARGRNTLCFYEP